MSGAQVFRQLQSIARADVGRGAGSATQFYVTRRAFESFLRGLAHTRQVRGFVLKGGLLLDVAAMEADEGVICDVDAIPVQKIRDASECRASG